MELLGFAIDNATTFMFVFVRTISILVVTPVLGSWGVPARMKVALSVILALTLTSVIPPVAMPQDLVGLLFIVFSEVLFGVTVGLLIKFIFTGVEFAGQISGFQMGLGMANVYDPINSVQITVIGRFLGMMAMLVFIAMDGHLLIIQTLWSSFIHVPPAGFVMDGRMIAHIVEFSGVVFEIGVKLAAPVVATLIFINAVLGIMARTVPQLNMFVVGFAITIMAGLFIIAMSMPLTEYVIRGFLDRMWLDVARFIRIV